MMAQSAASAESKFLSLGKHRAIVAESVDDVLEELGLPSYPDNLDICCPVPEDWSLEPEAKAILMAIIENTNCSSYVEVGAHRGQTGLAVARIMSAAGSGKVYAIEPELELAAEIENIAKAEQLPVTVISSSSWEAFNNWGREMIDVILVDGDHSLAATVFDIAAWSTLLAPNGWLIVHDTLTRLTRRFPEDYLPLPELFDIIDVVGMRQRPSGQSWEGIAFLRWSSDVKSCVENRFVSKTENQ
ncbi:MAG: class I SAM-dependent methyltransferase [Ketobacter sp.]|nr:class I SAM-dependent methyltransferase [Ketobacter sp.]